MPPRQPANPSKRQRTGGSQDIQALWALAEHVVRAARRPLGSRSSCLH
jgi:hypothetical protein